MSLQNISLRRWNVPWITPSLRKLIRKKQRSYNLAKKTNDRQDWKKFKDLRKASKHKLAEARNNYVLNLLDSPDEASPPKISKRFWSYIKSTRKDNLGVGTLKSGDTEIVNSEQKAEKLSDQFASVFTDENLFNIPNMGPSTITDIPPLKFDVSGITSLLRNIKVPLRRKFLFLFSPFSRSNPFYEYVIAKLAIN